MNLDISDPSVDPKKLFLEFSRYVQSEVSLGLFADSCFTDFAVFLWAYESFKPDEVHRVINNTDLLRREIQLLLAVWIEAGYLYISHGNNSETLFSFQKSVN
jgi:hypothetical protein